MGTFFRIKTIIKDRVDSFSEWKIAQEFDSFINVDELLFASFTENSLRFEIRDRQIMITKSHLQRWEHEGLQNLFDFLQGTMFERKNR